MNIVDAVHKYPTVFIGHDVDYHCNEGWVQIIDNLCNYLLMEYENTEDCELPTISYIKEKIGVLRIGFSGSEKHRDIVNFVEYQSQFICEYCSKPGTLKDLRGWYKTMCGDCNEHSR